VQQGGLGGPTRLLLAAALQFGLALPLLLSLFTLGFLLSGLLCKLFLVPGLGLSPLGTNAGQELTGRWVLNLKVLTLGQDRVELTYCLGALISCGKCGGLFFGGQDRRNLRGRRCTARTDGDQFRVCPFVGHAAPAGFV